MTAAVPLADQIRCVERELAMRRGVYANKVRNRRMTQAEADMEIARLTAVRATLTMSARPMSNPPIQDVEDEKLARLVETRIGQDFDGECHLAEHEAREIIDRLRSLSAENVELRAESADLTKALTGLTCSGSEFFIRKGERYVADIQACVEWVRRSKQDAHRSRADAILDRKKAEAERDALSASKIQQDEVIIMLTETASKHFARVVELEAALEQIRDQPDTSDKFGGRWFDWAKGRARDALAARLSSPVGPDFSPARDHDLSAGVKLEGGE